MLYKYQAKKITGEETSGTMEASSKTDLAGKLREQGYIPTLVEEKNKKSRAASFFSRFGIVSAADKIMFAKNLGVMLSAGLPISRALTALSRQTRNKKFKKVIADLEAEIQKGEPLSMAMDQHPEVFSALFAAMVRSGEKSGKLPESLNLISRQLEREMILKRRIKGALILTTP